MSELLFGHDKDISDWVLSKIPDAEDFGNCTAIGIIDRPRRILYGGIVYFNYSEKHKTICFALASVNPRWMTRENVRRLLSYPFRQLGVRKMMAFIADDNHRSNRLAKGLGFKNECRLRHQFDDGRHVLVWSMMANEFEGKWGGPDSFSKFRRNEVRQRSRAIDAMISVPEDADT